MIRIIGIGSPFGDDQVGWKVIEFLRQSDMDDRAELITLDRPYLQLLPFLKDAACVYLIDAVCSDQPLGTITEITDLALLNPSFSASSHQVGMAEVLELATSLKQLPRELYIYGIEIEIPSPHAFPSAHLHSNVQEGARNMAILLKHKIA